ncbi:4-hydroxy-tetrahydrodipicolinate reductase [Clostridium sp. JS66]|uniref:4-hydroxy-tetrahydrodipicolinate reductase n=1 Tax=Clostridium sp. JS66 TaxID=3064705 RepID=UPI00298E284A|nr:4-hydroxy-tetrahydrodipicolinate reductase [Clostridium sp. JS66]WPC41368.1 4-hydroxy-tetrahydrodipicolinate reductase [Clostridium sp. JS66]
MVKIILSGCNGKMGKVISKLADSSSDLTIAAGIDKNTEKTSFPVFADISKCTVDADVILDFSRPDALEGLLKYSKEKNIGIVLCTTGYTKEQIDEINKASKEIPVFRSANMSIGINVINKVLRNISELLYKDFDIEIIEKHHHQKVDAPSGTAILLGNTIKDSIHEETKFVYGREGISKRTHDEIGIHAVRGGSIVGDHEVIFAGKDEIIELKHTAMSRDIFAIGALKACQFMFGKDKGLYSMDDVIK